MNGYLDEWGFYPEPEPAQPPPVEWFDITRPHDLPDMVLLDVRSGNIKRVLGGHVLRLTRPPAHPTAPPAR